MTLPNIQSLSLEQLIQLIEAAHTRANELHTQRQQRAVNLLKEIREANQTLDQLLGEESGPANLLSLRAAQRLDRDTYADKQDVVVKMLHQTQIVLTEQVQRLGRALRDVAESTLGPSV